MNQIYAMMGTFALIFLVLFIITAAIGWKIFDKAGQPGWASLVPIYNQWILVTEICKKEPLWFVLGLIPCANVVAAWVICTELAKKFGKSDTFGMGLFFFTPICAAILAFGDSRYRGGRKAIDFDDEDDFEEEEEEAPRPKRKPRRDDY